MLVGRDRELQRLVTALGVVPVGVVFGVAGVGKSALVLEFAARWSGPTVYLVASGELSLAQICDSVHRQLGVPRPEISTDDRAQLRALWTAANRLSALLVIDDAHALPPALRDALIDTAAHQLEGGRLVAVSRERIAMSPGAPDRLQLRLEALERAPAQVLWHQLTELYGPGGDFEVAWQRSRGNPLVMRQMILGDQTAAHPLASTVRALTSDERWLAAAVALSSAPLPRHALSRLLPPERAARAREVLVTRLVIDTTAGGDHVMHDLFRDAVLGEIDDDTAAAIARALVTALGMNEAMTWLNGSVHGSGDCVEEWTRMRIACDRGERLAPLVYFQRVQHLLDRGGHFVGAAFARAATGKLLLLLGRRTAGLAVLDELRARCRDRGTSGFDPIIAAALQEDPLAPAWLARGSDLTLARKGDAIRAETRALLRRACSARQLSLPSIELPDDADHAFDRALVALAHAAVARRHGQPRVAAQHLERAIAAAADAGADDDLVPRIYDALPIWGPRGQASDPDDPAHALVIDGVMHEIRRGELKISVASRGVLRRLLYAFVSAADGHLSRDAIAQALWEVDYDPLRHESTVKSNIRRLRSVLADTGAVLEHERDGYRLLLPPGALVILTPASS